jgi:hypothetical protein
MPLLLAAQLLAAQPLPLGSVVPFNAPAVASPASVSAFQAELGPVETFDPSGRARDLAASIPRVWKGSYQSFIDGKVVPAELRLASVVAIGQIVDLRGELSVGGVITPVQGNLNAKSDQLDLIPLAGNPGAQLELGGAFQGLQGVTLAGWNAPRLTHPGGILDLQPPRPAPRQSVRNAEAVRGLW